MNIELLRMVCAVGVVLAHLRVFPTNNITNEYLSLGAIGVDFFFLISGYSMMAMLKKYHIEDKKGSVLFVLNRFIRVAIPYYLATIIMIFLFSYFDKIVSFKSIINSLLFLRNFNSDLGRDFFPILPPGWTINYEILFYLALSISILFFRKTKYAIVLFIASMLTSLFIPISYLWIELFIGAAIFTHQKRVMQIIRRIGIIAPYLIVSICAFIIVRNKQLSGEEIYIYQRLLFWGIPATFIFISVVFGKSVKFMPVANFSYSIYLIHWPIMYILDKVNMGFSVIYVCLAVLIFSYIFYIFVEKPCMKLSKKLFHIDCPKNLTIQVRSEG